MRSFAIPAVIGALLLAGPSSAADDLYIAKVNTLATNGQVSTNVIATTADGVSSSECELRKAAWMREHWAGYEALMAELRKQGKTVEMSVTCERKS